MIGTSAIITLLWCATSTFAQEGDPVVTLPYGRIRGHVLQSQNDNVYYAFQEIPYASPPIGDLRFKSPVPPTNWDGILETQRNTKICYQQDNYQPTPNTTETEDCLYLNVYTPQRPGSSTLLPVLVWIHGGGFISGDGTFGPLGPKFFIDSDIVIVTINYRLGPLGFLTTSDGVIPGNLGLKDQSFAFKWVKDNIRLFAGDPEKITIAGESAGAFSIGHQLISKQNEGVFRGAILESGTSLCPDGYQNFSRYIAFELGKALNPSFDSDDSNDLLEVLRNASAANITSTTLDIPEDKHTGALLWTPVIEDENEEGALLTGPMDEDMKNGNFNRVPIIIGFNTEEETGFIAFDQTDIKQTGIQFDADPSIMVRIPFNIDEDKRADAGKELRKIYTDASFQEDFPALVTYTSDYRFTTPLLRHAALQSQFTDVYLYQLSYKGDLGKWAANVPVIDGLDPNLVGHGEDLGYIWDNGLNSDASKYIEQDILTRNRILKLWSNFVKYLNPTPEEDTLLQNVIWPKVTKDRMSYLNINDTLEVDVDPKKYKQWKKIVDSYGTPPYITY